MTLTELGLGTAQFGNLLRETSEEQVASAVAEAWRGGIRYFDTAPHYGLGLSERRLGAELAGLPREEYVLSTKVGRVLEPSPQNAHQTDDEGFAVPADHRRVWDFSRDGILRSVEDSLTRLRLDRIDVLYLHDPDDHFDQASTEGVNTLIELREQGVVQAVGAGMNQSALLAQLIERADVDLVMLAGRYTLLDQSALADLLPLALQHGVGVIVAGAYNSGLLSRDRPDIHATYDYEPAPNALLVRANRIADICESHGVRLPEAALAFPLLHPAVVSIVVGARDGSQVHDALQRRDCAVPPELWSDLRSAGLLPPIDEDPR